jgi:hypothetical protein
MAQERRDTLKIIGAIGATCAFPFPADELYGQHNHTPPAAATSGPYAPQVFTKDQFDLVSRVADLIIPPTDTPGAAQAGVPEYIDRVVSANPEHRGRFREGLAWLDGAALKAHGRKFLQLSAEQQIAILKPLSDGADDNENPQPPEVRFFRVFKSMTADGYYTSEAGLVQELGYRGNTVLAKFPECGVPEH